MSNSQRARKLRLLSRLKSERKRIALVFQVTLFVRSGWLLTLSAKKVGGRVMWSYGLGSAATAAIPALSLSVERRLGTGGGP